MKTIKTEESGYRTTVNIHNPTSNQVTIAAQVALASNLAGSDPGPFGITPVKEVVLQPDGAVGVGCFDVAGYFRPIDGVCVGSTEPSKPGSGKRVDYPPKGSPAYGDKVPTQRCGGIAGFPCHAGKTCVDDPSDNCDPARGSADCSGICVSSPGKNKAMPE